MSISILPVTGVPVIHPGDDLPALLLAALDASDIAVQDGDVMVVCQKVVSKAEGRLVDLRTVSPSPLARHIAAASESRDPRIVEVILSETRRIVRMDSGHLIVETGRGWVCANAGVDSSNSGDPNLVILLPADPDASAARITAAVHEQRGRAIAVIISDTFGRPWRIGLVDFALGVANMKPLLDLRGSTDLDGRDLQHTVMAHADALTAAAGLVMGKGDGVPAAVIRGYAFDLAAGSGADLIRPKETDLFR